LKIINMAERRKDEADLKLDALFGSAPVPDDGFSARVVSRVRRRIWVRRLALPVGIAAGALVGGKPLLDLVGILSGLVRVVPADIIGKELLPVGGMPTLSTVLIGATILMAVMIVARLLEE